LGIIKVHEVTTTAGALSDIFLRFEEGVFALITDDGTFELPEGALDATMARFGAPLEPGERIAIVSALDLGAGRVVRHVRHLARFDVIARDYLVYEKPGRETACALATTVAGALDHLARAGQRRD
jgi:hypothetical protein